MSSARAYSGDRLEEAERRQEAADDDALHGLGHDPGDLDPLGERSSRDRRGQVELERVLGGKAEPGVRLSTDHARASEQPGAADVVAEHGEEVRRRLVVRVAIELESWAVVPVALVARKRCAWIAARSWRRRRDTALDLSAAGSDTREHVHLGRRKSASLRPFAARRVKRRCVAGLRAERRDFRPRETSANAIDSTTVAGARATRNAARIPPRADARAHSHTCVVIVAAGRSPRLEGSVTETNRIDNRIDNTVATRASRVEDRAQRT